MRVLLADSLDDAAVDALTAAGDDVRSEPELSATDLPDRIGDADVLVVRSTKVTGEALVAGASLGLVVRAGAGTNTIDCARAAELGIVVANVPGRNAVAVAELTMGLLIAIDRHIADATADLRAGRWDKARYSRADGLLGRSMGVVGLGDIGLAVAERAAAFGMSILAEHRPGRSAAAQLRASRIGVELVADRVELLGRCDVVTIHVPSSPATFGLVDAAFLGAMRDGAIMLNTSRGDTIVADDLIAAMDAKGIRAGLDVFPDEPPSGSAAYESALAAHPNVVGTHHIGASTQQAQAAVAAGTVEVIDAYRRGEVLHAVNIEAAPHRTCTLNVRHLDRVGVLASVFDLLRRNDINVETMQNRVFAGSVAAVATIDVAGRIDDDLRIALNDLDDVIAVTFNPA